MQTWWQDFRYAVRMLGKNVTLTFGIVASLAIGIGANAAIFSVVDALLLRPLPYPHADRLVAVWIHSPGIGIFRDWPSPGQYLDVQNENHSFEEMALAQSRPFTLTGHERPEHVAGTRGQSSLLRILGATPFLGRLRLPEEESARKTSGSHSRLPILATPIPLRPEHTRPSGDAGRRSIYDRRRLATDSLARQRFSSTMLGAFAAFALLLAAVGLYGVVSYLVSQSTRDIGVLVAMGAQPGNIIRLVLHQEMELAGIGILAGLAGAFALTRVMTSLPFELSALDTLTFAVMPLLLASVAFAANAIPAWRATRVEPMVALCEEKAGFSSSRRNVNRLLVCAVDKILWAVGEFEVRRNRKQGSIRFRTHDIGELKRLFAHTWIAALAVDDGLQIG